MTPAEIEAYLVQGFSDELEDDMAFERAVARRCLYAVAIVVAVIIARAIWFV